MAAPIYRMMRVDIAGQIDHDAAPKVKIGFTFLDTGCSHNHRSPSTAYNCRPHPRFMDMAVSNDRGKNVDPVHRGRAMAGAPVLR